MTFVEMSQKNLQISKNKTLLTSSPFSSEPNLVDFNACDNLQASTLDQIATVRKTVFFGFFLHKFAILFDKLFQKLMKDKSGFLWERFYFYPLSID